MRQCNKRGCGVILLDTDMTCPVCGSETVDVGPLKKERQYEDAAPLPLIRRKRGSRIVALVVLVVGGWLAYYAWQQIQTGQPTTFDSSLGTRLIEKITSPFKRN